MMLVLPELEVPLMTTTMPGIVGNKSGSISLPLLVIDRSYLVPLFLAAAPDFLAVVFLGAAFFSAAGATAALLSSFMRRPLRREALRRCTERFWDACSRA